MSKLDEFQREIEKVYSQSKWNNAENFSTSEDIYDFLDWILSMIDEIRKDE